MKSLAKFSLIVILIFSYLNSSGQIAMGLKVGRHLTTWDVDFEGNFDLNDPRLKRDYQFGGVIEIRLNKLISIQPEFLYLRKGPRFKSPTSQKIKQKLIYTFNYIESPVLLKLNFVDLDNTNFFITAGPSFGYGLNGKYVLSSEDISEKDAEELEFKGEDELNRINVSAAFGAGVGFPVGPGTLVFELRYLHGLSNFLSENSNNDSIKNRILSMSMGYMIPLSKKKKKDK